MDCFVGVDVGSVSTKLVLMNADENIEFKTYLKTAGRPIEALKQAMSEAAGLGCAANVLGAGATGSGRQLAGVIAGADIVKNEITAHAVAAGKAIPDVGTVLEIGGQDSKLIQLEDGIVSDFAMNTVCAAGTGSFLDRQAERLGIPIEEFGNVALKSKSPVRIAGRCAVFAESDMIHKQQSGHSVEDISSGLCEALVRNYLNNLAKGKKLKASVVFQGGVAANAGMVHAFEQALGLKVTVPEHYDVMGAYGAALLAKRHMAECGKPSGFIGWEAAQGDYCTQSFSCDGCANICEIIRVLKDGLPIQCWGGRCNKWEDVKSYS